MAKRFAGYIRYAVVREGRSLLDASYTPEYFGERALDQAKACARRMGGTVCDLWGEGPFCKIISHEEAL